MKYNIIKSVWCGDRKSLSHVKAEEYVFNAFSDFYNMSDINKAFQQAANRNKEYQDQGCECQVEVRETE